MNELLLIDTDKIMWILKTYSVKFSSLDKTKESKMEDAKREINKSLSYIRYCMRCLGLSFHQKKTSIQQKFMFLLSVICISYHIFGDIVYIGVTLSNSPRFEDVIPYFHTFGFGILSYAKVFVLWYKKDEFGGLINDLYVIWPVSGLDEAGQAVKEKSLLALNIAHRWYYLINAVGVAFYILQPIVYYIYLLGMGEDVQMGFIWATWYPFDKRQPIFHALVYIYESFIGMTCVWIMTATDLLFSAMASHICLLLRILQSRLEMIAHNGLSNDEYYREIVDTIETHQRLIRYCTQLEDAFSMSIFINYVLSSVNICCVVFVIVLLESFYVISNKLFLASALVQIGLICWYGDEILQANGDIAKAAYNSGWYRTDDRCRKTLQFLIMRAQKPIAFTALKFTKISLVTYSSILTRSYSYFALLYTMFNNNN